MLVLQLGRGRHAIAMSVSRTVNTHAFHEGDLDYRGLPNTRPNPRRWLRAERVTSFKRRAVRGNKFPALKLKSKSGRPKIVRRLGC